MKLVPLLYEMNRYEKEIGKVDRPDWKDSIQKYLTSDPLNPKEIYFMNFSDREMLTMNPFNTWNTPTGIYGYPILKEAHIAFATERKYIHIFKVEGNILNFGNYDQNKFDIDVSKIKELIGPESSPIRIAI